MSITQDQDPRMATPETRAKVEALCDAMCEACCPLQPDPSAMMAAVAQLMLSSVCCLIQKEHALDEFDTWVKYARERIERSVSTKQ